MLYLSSSKNGRKKCFTVQICKKIINTILKKINKETVNKFSIIPIIIIIPIFELEFINTILCVLQILTCYIFALINSRNCADKKSKDIASQNYILVCHFKF